MDNTLAMTINDISSEWRKASSLAGTGPGADSDASNTGMDALGLDFADALSSSTSGALSDSSESPGPLFSPPVSTFFVLDALWLGWARCLWVIGGWGKEIRIWVFDGPDPN